MNRIYTTLGVVITSFFLFFGYTTHAQLTRNYATNFVNASTATGSSNAPVDAPSAYDSSPLTFATLNANAGILGIGAKSSFIEIQFPSAVPAGSPTYLVLSQDGQVSLLNVLLGGTIGGLVDGLAGVLFGTPNVEITLKNAGSTVETIVLDPDATANVQFGPEGYMYLILNPGETYNSIRIEVENIAVLGLGESATTSLNVHGAFYHTGTALACEDFLTTKYDVTGLTATILGSNPDPIRNIEYAIDADATNYSELGYSATISAGALSSYSQTIYYNKVMSSGEQATVIIDRQSPLLTLDLLNSISVTAYNGATSVYTTTMGSLLSAEALSIISLTLGSGIPDRISVPVPAAFDRITLSYSQTLGVGVVPTPLHLYGIQITPPQPEVDNLENDICEGLTKEIAVLTPASGANYTWFDSELSPISTGATYVATAPPLGESDTYFVASHYCPNVYSAYTPVVITTTNTACLPSDISGLADNSEYITVNPLNAVLTQSSTVQAVEPVSASGDFEFTGVERGDYTVFLVNYSTTVGATVSESTIDPGYYLTPTSAALTVDGSGDPITSSGFTISTTPLSVDGITLKAVLNSSRVILNWSSQATGENVQSYEVERSADGRNWQSVHTMNPVSLPDHTYQYADNSLSEGLIYYRIKRVKISGEKSYSNVAVIDFKKNSPYTIAPNPVRSTMSIQGLNGKEMISIVDIAGRKVVDTKADIQTEFSMEHLSNGVYILTITDASNNQHSFKVIKE